MKKVTILFIWSVFMVSLNAQTLCDKLSLPVDKITNFHYRDCKQPLINYTKDEQLAYKVCNDNCTQRDLKAKKEAIQRLKDADEWVDNFSESQMESLAYSIPNYDTWSVHKIRKYKEALKAQKQKNNFD